jgi:uncharacterized membrane protein (UPF0127 family)
MQTLATAARCVVIAAMLALSTASLLPPSPAVARELKHEQAVLVTETGRHVFDVEIADRDETRARGLMFRTNLGARQGMLFVYDAEQRISMWMRNTYIPLDMIFITRDGTVRRIEENTETFSERIIESGGRILAVLEVNAGTAAELKLKPGDRVVNPRFKASAAKP